MGELIYHPAAKAEAQEAAAYYEECCEGLGQAFLREVEEATGRVREHPLRWRRLGGRFRRVLLHRFPYGIVYALEPEEIYIVAVSHLKRRPGYWRSRLENGS